MTRSATQQPRSLCGVHERGADGVGGAACPACIGMVRLAGETITDTHVAGSAGGRATWRKHRVSQ